MLRAWDIRDMRELFPRVKDYVAVAVALYVASNNAVENAAFRVKLYENVLLIYRIFRQRVIGKAFGRGGALRFAFGRGGKLSARNSRAAAQHSSANQRSKCFCNSVHIYSVR